MAELRAIIEYNDGVPPRARVSADAASEMLRGYGWTCTSRTGLDSLCRRELGRTSYGTR